jgi:REP element-mobilizing transposase RayT
MPRTARRKSSTGIYHIILRGINRQTIFYDEEDNEKFIQTIADFKRVSGFSIFGYCLMGNHVHLLIQEEREGFSITLSSKSCIRVNAITSCFMVLFYDRGDISLDTLHDDIIA